MTVALGFAFKDIIENFFAGILILWKFPFDVGDFVECQGIEGKLEAIELRMTLIRRTDGQLIMIPNAMMFKNPVRVMTADDVRRTAITCGIAYGEDVAEGRSVIQQAVESCQTVDQSKPVQVFAQEFASSSINFEVTWWTKPTPLDVRESRDEVVEAVKEALDDAGIEIPHPYMTLTFTKNEPAIIFRLRWLCRVKRIRPRPPRSAFGASGEHLHALSKDQQLPFRFSSSGIKRRPRE